jgi:acetamidase/formamidase
MATAPDMKCWDIAHQLRQRHGVGRETSDLLRRCSGSDHLPAVHERGGLLFFGDLHASQGDGERCGVANEVSGTVRLRCDVMKGRWLRNVRVENDRSLISVCCYRPVEEAMKQAVRDMILWLEHDYGLSRREAYLLLSMCPDFHLRTYQMCSGLGRLMTTAGAEFPKYLLGV